MNRVKEQNHNWALIVGAAEGIGRGFSEVLANKGFNLLMVDINKAAMEQLALEISERYGTVTRTRHLDLATEGAWVSCMEMVTGTACSMMVYIAAYSKIKPFLASTEDALNQYFRVNVQTPLHLTHAFANALVSRKTPGGIILIASLAGLVGAPLVAPYSASKGYLIRLAESLSSEFKPHHISITACCAGLTSTPTYLANTPEKSRHHIKPMEPIKVAEYAIRQLGKKAVCIPGWKNRLSYCFLTRVLPRGIALHLVGHAMKKMYNDSV